VSLAKKPSAALSHEHDVGVKWKVKRWCRSSHWRTFDGVISIEMPVHPPLSHAATPTGIPARTQPSGPIQWLQMRAKQVLCHLANEDQSKR